MHDRPATRLVTYYLLLAISTLLVAAVAYPIWQPLLLATITAAALNPWCEGLATKLGGRRVLATSLVLSGVTLLIIIPLSILLTVAISQTIAAIAFVRAALAQGGVGKLVSKLPDRLESIAEWLLKLLPGGLRDLVDKVGGGAHVADWAGAFVSSITEAIFQILVVLLALYFLLLDGPSLVSWLAERAPLGEVRTRRLLREYRTAARAVLGSTILTAAAQAVAAGIGYLLAGVPQPLFFTLLTFLCAFLPSVGTAIVALPLCLLLWGTDHSMAALFLAAWSTVVVASVDNLLKPFLMSDGMQMHGALVFFALLGAVVVFGPIGVVLGPLILTFFLSMVNLWRDLDDEPAPVAIAIAPDIAAASPAPADAAEPTAPAAASSAAPESKDPSCEEPPSS